MNDVSSETPTQQPTTVSPTTTPVPTFATLQFERDITTFENLKNSIADNMKLNIVEDIDFDEAITISGIR